MTIDKHISSIKKLISRGLASDDFNWSSNFIAHLLKTSRALLIKRRINKYHKISDANYQTVCIPLELVDYHNCDCITDINCKILRSKFQLPSFISKRSSNGVTVKLLDGTTISYMDNSSSKFSKYSITSNSDMTFFLENSYLYIQNYKTIVTDETNLKVIVKGIPEDPLELADIVNCEDAENSSICNEEFPIDSDLIDPLYDLVIRRLLQTNNLPQDNRNDARSPESLNRVEPNES